MKPIEKMPTSSAIAEEVGISFAAKFRARMKDAYFWSDWIVVVAFVLVIAVFGAIAPHTFLTMYNLNNILVAAAIPTIIVVGQTFAVLTAGIDLSVSSTMTLGAVSFGLAFTNNYPLWSCVLIGMAAGGAAGFLNGFIIAKRKINDFIVTLGMLSVASGLALVLSNGEPRQIVSSKLSTIAIGGWGNIPYLMIIAIVIVLVAHFVLFYTRFGTHVLAVGGDPDAARSMGISIPRIKIAVYVISGLLAGFAATLTISRIGAAEPAANTSILLNSVAAVVLGGVSLFGGRGTIVGPFIATLLLQSLTNGLTVVGVAAYYQYVSIGLVVILSAALVRTNQ